MNHDVINKIRDQMHFLFRKKKLKKENRRWIVLENVLIDSSTLQEIFSSVSKCLSNNSTEKKH